MKAKVRQAHRLALLLGLWCGVESIYETGVTVAGKKYELDCLIFASGFEISLAHSASYETIGRNGLKL